MSYQYPSPILYKTKNPSPIFDSFFIIEFECIVHYTYFLFSLVNVSI